MAKEMSEKPENPETKKKKKNKLPGSILFVCMFLLFIGIMDYPFIAQLINAKTQAQVVQNYDFRISNEDEAWMKAELEKAYTYNQRLASKNGVALQDAFQAVEPGSTEYLSLLNATEDGIMGIVVIPKIKEELPIYHGTLEYALQHGTGHLQGTSLPVGGESTHACISGHRGLPNKKLFTSLDLLERGDVFYIRIFGETLAYEIFDIQEVLPDQVEPLKIQDGKDLVTLITCTPYGINTHRLFVTGKRIPYQEDGENGIGQKTFSWMDVFRDWWWVAATILLLLLMIRMLVIYNRGPKKKKAKKKKEDMKG